MPIIVKNVSFTYMPGTPFERQALKNVNLSIEQGEKVALIGHTGSGKSTLAELMAGLMPPTAGSVSIDAVDLNGKDKRSSKLARAQVGMVFQYPEQQLFAETVYDDVAFGPRNLGRSEGEVREAVTQALSFVDLAVEEIGPRSPFGLSGGQMRRVAIAGVVALNPKYLILDEPTAGLDPRSRNWLFTHLEKWQHKAQSTLILITHSMEEAATYADRLLVMDAGQLIINGKTAEVFRSERQKLHAVGLAEPEPLTVAELLASKGLGEMGEPLTAEALLRAIRKVKRWR